MILKFGKYKGKDLKEVAKLNPSYAIWYARKFNYELEVYEIANEVFNIANSYRI